MCILTHTRAHTHTPPVTVITKLYEVRAKGVSSRPETPRGRIHTVGLSYIYIYISKYTRKRTNSKTGIVRS